MKVLNILLSLGSIFSMIASIIFHFLIVARIPWFYITSGSVIYLAAILFLVDIFVNNGINKKSLNRLLLGSHLSYFLIAGGTFLVAGFWSSLGILITCIALGFIPSIIATILESID